MEGRDGGTSEQRNNPAESWSGVALRTEHVGEQAWRFGWRRQIAFGAMGRGNVAECAPIAYFVRCIAPPSRGKRAVVKLAVQRHAALPDDESDGFILAWQCLCGREPVSHLSAPATAEAVLTDTEACVVPTPHHTRHYAR